MGRSTAATALPFPSEGLGRYELGAQIAAGGMGTIFQARDRLADREVAYKRLRVPHDDMRARMTALFQREYDTLARLPHPNIVEVYDYGIDVEGPFYVMELLSGADLTKLAPLPFPEACRLLRDLASALALLHARRLLHRDVSPNNVRMTSDGRAKLIDFGALMPFGKPRELVGTPAFVAPECLQDDAALDQRSDLYSLGAVAYWALTHRTAVHARTLDALPAALGEPLLPPSAHVRGIPHALDELVMSLLAHDPIARPASAAQVIERLTSISDLAPETDVRGVAYSYLAHPPLFGRTEICASLQNAVCEGIDQGAKVLLIEGAQGLGRSALLEAVATHAQLAGSTVLRAQGDRGGGPFSLAHRLLELVGIVDPDLDGGPPAPEPPFLRSRAEEPRASVARGGRTGGDIEAAERHAAVVTRVQEVLVALSARGPLVIAVDDVHAADVQSLALLGALVDETLRHPITLVLSALAGEHRADAPGFATVVAHARGYALAPLDEADMIALFDALLGGAPNSRRLASWLHEQSGGNPATAMDLARLLLQREVIRYTLGTFTVPHDVSLDLTHADVTNAALARLDGVTPLAHQVADLLALHPGWLNLAQLTYASECSPSDVLHALEELLVRQVAAYGREGFLLLGTRLRDALSGALRRSMRGALHVRLARALLDHPDGTLDLRFAAAQHLLKGGEERDAEALVTEAARHPIDGETAARWVDLLERVLSVYRRQKRSEEQCLALMIPLGLSGFWGSLKTHHHHLDAALTSLSNVCGMTLSRRLRPWLGAKLALLAGIAYAALRRALCPERERLGTVRAMLVDFLTLVGTGTASAASALESESALRYASLLEPFSAMPPEAPIALARQFSLATAEVGRGDLRSASERYARLMPQVAAPRDDFDEALRRQAYLGCLNGRAQAEASECSPNALALADELERGDPFFGPHAECARMTYHGHRGDQKRAELHRARAELLALRGGSSWSAVTVLMVRRACIAAETRDAIGLVQAIAELDRLSTIAPKLALVKQAAEASLEHLRGRPARAVSLFAESFAQEGARLLPSHAFFCALYAGALNAAGQHAEAKLMCAEQLESAHHLPLLARARMRAEAALAEAGLGQLTYATSLLDALLAEARPWDNPLLRGDLHRARARLALLMNDREAFAHHHAAMSEHFRATENASLIRQCAALLGEAQQAGVADAVRDTTSPPPAQLMQTEERETSVRTT